MTAKQRMYIKDCVERLMILVDINAPDEVIKAEIELLNKLAEDDVRNN